MSKFKIGDRVRLLSDAWSCARKESGPAPRFGRAGEVGVIIEVGPMVDGQRGWDVSGVGEFARSWFAEEQLEHADPQPPVVHHDRVVADTHAAIDRLVAHLERQATEHVHALDALRAENEALRTQNAHLRALQAAQEAKPVREVDRNPDKVARTTIAGLPALSEAKDGPRRRHAVKHARGYVLYDENDRIVACEATDDVALGWCQFGWPYVAKPAEPKQVREVVRGQMYDHQAIALDAATFTSERGRFAVLWHDGWSIYLSGAHPSEDETRCMRLTNDQAIAWVLDSVLPKR